MCVLFAKLQEGRDNVYYIIFEFLVLHAASVFIFSGQKYLQKNINEGKAN